MSVERLIAEVNKIASERYALTAFESFSVRSLNDGFIKSTYTISEPGRDVAEYTAMTALQEGHPIDKSSFDRSVKLLVSVIKKGRQFDRLYRSYADV